MKNTLRLTAHTLSGRCSGRRKLHRDVFCMSQTKSWNIFRLSDRRYKHTHTADGVISQSTCAQRVGPCLNIRLNPLPLDGKSKPATRRWFYSNPEVHQHRRWPPIRVIKHFTQFMSCWHESGSKQDLFYIPDATMNRLVVTYQHQSSIIMVMVMRTSLVAEYTDRSIKSSGH